MSNLAATDVTVTVLSRRKVEGRNVFNLQLAFGNGALTYPAGGVPLSLAKAGFPNQVDSLVVYDKGVSGYEWSYDRTNGKLVAMRSGANTAAAHAHDLLVKGGQAGSTTNDIAHYATDILGKEAATDATILGSASATKGGVMSASAQAVAAAVLAEPSTVAIAAQVLKCVVTGY